MALYIPHSVFHLARLLYVRPEILDPTKYVLFFERNYIPSHLHSFHTLHIKAELKQGNIWVWIFQNIFVSLWSSLQVKVCKTDCNDI